MTVYKLVISQDADPMTPREWSNLGQMVCLHKRYDLGDAHDLKSGMFESWAELKQYLIKEENAAVILPLYLIDHSGLSMSVTPFGCPWDSGQVGFIYATQQAILQEYGKKRLTARLKQRVEQALVSEVDVYHRYLSGDVWEYALFDEDDNFVEGCAGFFGYDDAREEGEQMKCYLEQKEAQERQQQRQQQVAQLLGFFPSSQLV